MKGAPRLTGIVLGGGRSTRFGRPKPLLTVGGQLVLARVAAALRKACEETILVVREDQDDATPTTGIALRMHIVADSVAGAGPIAGIEAGLEACQTALAFVVGADHPFLSPALIRAMAVLAAVDDADAVAPRLDDRWRPLHAVYNRRLLPAVREALATHRSMYKILEQAAPRGPHRVRAFDRAAIQEHDPDLRSLYDIDTPMRLAQARRLAAGRAARWDRSHGG